jgi:hypothetical protein
VYKLGPKNVQAPNYDNRIQFISDIPIIIDCISVAEMLRKHIACYVKTEKAILK